MGKLGILSRSFASKTVAAVILGFLLGLFTEILVFFVPNEMKLRFALILLFPILVFLIYISGLFGQLVVRYRKWRRFRSPILIGVLKEFVDESKKGIACDPIYTKKEDWFDFFQKKILNKKKMFGVDEIFWSKISSKYAAIINPFGEVYLESNKRSFLTFEKIKEFVANGGIFCCTGGFPFIIIGMR